MRQIIFAIIVTLLLFLSACGGGGSSSSNPTVTTMPEIVVPEVPRPETTITTSRVQDSADRETVIRYLRDATDGKMIRHLTAPTLRFAASTDAIRRNYTRRAVEIVNSALPYQNRIRIDADTSDRSGDVPNGEIFVDFVPSRHYPGTPGSRARAERIKFNKDPANPSFSTHIWVDRDNFENDIAHNLNRDDMTRVMVHEILHALGMTAHVQTFPSVMYLRSQYDMQPIDRDGLAALHTLNTGDTAFDLGPWSDMSTNIRGDLGEVAFGVRSNNGVSTPWIDGPEPPTYLAPLGIDAFDQETPLSGTVTWRGTMVGHTPSIETVTGNADLEINLPLRRSRAVAGKLRFGNIEFRETGAPWNTGSLDYSVTVSRNGFVKTGGDEGVASGAFFGDNHELMGGILERPDLTAAFGATR